MAVFGGWWLLTLWAHVALPDPLPFAVVLLVLTGSAARLAGHGTSDARAVPGERFRAVRGTPRRGPDESSGLAAMRATLRGLEAELQALEEQRTTERPYTDAGTGREAEQTMCGAGR